MNFLRLLARYEHAPFLVKMQLFNAKACFVKVAVVYPLQLVLFDTSLMMLFLEETFFCNPGLSFLKVQREMAISVSGPCSCT